MSSFCFKDSVHSSYDRLHRFVQKPLKSKANPSENRLNMYFDGRYNQNHEYFFLFLPVTAARAQPILPCVYLFWLSNATPVSFNQNILECCFK